MIQKRFFHLVVLAFALLVSVGCETTEAGDVAPDYGVLQVGDEEMTIKTVRVYDEDMFMVMLSPLTDLSSLTTSAFVGIKSELLGQEVDVYYKFHNDDYMLVYEDPQCYYAPFRPLQSGTIYMQKRGKNLKIEVDVVLYDGTPFRYSNDALPLQ